jgi:16S rRNA (uracil1498-N3)-methyltransferase
MKQSLKSTQTKLNDSCLFDDFIIIKQRGSPMIAYCDNEPPKSKIGEVYSKGNDAVLLIGPEGDFSEEEIKTAIGTGYIPVHLGQSRLRSETAGIAACYSIYYINQ